MTGDIGIKYESESLLRLRRVHVFLTKMCVHLNMYHARICLIYLWYRSLCSDTSIILQCYYFLISIFLQIVYYGRLTYNSHNRLKMTGSDYYLDIFS